MTKHETYDPGVDVTPLTEWDARWVDDELEPVLFVLNHPIELQSGDRTYRHPAGTIIMIMGLAEKKEQTNETNSNS